MIHGPRQDIRALSGPVSMSSSESTNDPGGHEQPGIAWVVRLVYPLRMAGFFLTLMVLSTSLYDRDLPTWAWVIICAQTLSWPHLAYWHARRRRDSKAGELLNLTLDCVIAGVYSVVASFSLLPCAFMIGSTLFDSLSIGGPRLLWRGVLGAALGMLLAIPLIDYTVLIETNLIGSFTSVLALFVFIGIVSTYSYRSNQHFISAKRRLEAKAAELEVAREAAEAANRAKSRFLANVSHELRTPMNAIIGFTDLLLRSETDAQRQTQLQHVDAASHSLLALINQVLDLSKIESGRLELECRAFDLRVMLDKLDALFQSQAEGRGLRFSIEVAADVPTALTGDALRLEQVLLNLLGNAFKFTHEGEVTLSVSIVERLDERLRLGFTVRDSGIGISDEQRERLFTAFSQADSSTTRKYGGTGLGLVISRQLVSLMGGELTMDSMLEQGSEFHFSVLLTLADAAALPPERVREAISAVPVAQTLEGVRVLLAEDNDQNRELAAAIMEDAGVALDIVEDGKQALAAVQAKAYDLVLMDMQMPEMDGIEATQSIRALDQLKSLPIIAMTANAMKQDREACLAAGMNDFLTKPIDAELLLNKLAQWKSAAAG